MNQTQYQTDNFINCEECGRKVSFPWRSTFLARKTMLCRICSTRKTAEKRRIKTWKKKIIGSIPLWNL